MIVSVALFVSDNRGHRRNHSDESLHLRSPTPDAMPGEACDVDVPAHVIPVTPLVVGEVMSKDDVFYTPHRDNPFTERFKSTKLVGSLRDNLCEWFELPSPANALTPPCTPRESVSIPGGRRKSVSLPGSPTLSRREMDKLSFEALASPSASAGSSTLRSTMSMMSSLRRLELDVDMEDIDACSEGSSSTDSAVDLMMMRDHHRSARYLRRQLSNSHGRHLSIDPGFLSSPSSAGSGGGVHSRTDIITRYMEAKRMAERTASNQPSSSVSIDHLASYSSSELSLDELSLLSPTSSYSSYTDTAAAAAAHAAAGIDSHFSAAHLEIYEHRLRSRQKFQELVASWEAKHAAQQDSKDTGSPSPGASSSSSSSSKPPVTHQQVREMRRQLYLHERLEHTDPHLKKFHEIRRKWEMKQLTESSKLAAAAQVSAVAAAAAAADQQAETSKQK